MRKITIDEFNSFPSNEFGIKQCPGYADYSAIKLFGECCSFGERCKIENEYVLIENHILILSGFGSKNRCTYVFNTADRILIRCGCFLGSIDEFEIKVEETHNDNKYAREYKAMINLIKIKYNGGETE